MEGPDVRTDGDAQPPRAFIRWSAHLLSALCLLGIAATGAIALAQFLNVMPEGWINDAKPVGRQNTLFEFSVAMHDPVAHLEIMKGLRADWLNRIVSLLPPALLIWALLSARASIVGVGRGEYFARPTVLGLRNLSLAVLLYQTIAPLIVLIPRALYVARVKGPQIAEMDMAVGFTVPVVLVLIFTAVVAMVSTGMVHAAKLAEENRQFI